jgi:hypothetical protein
MFELDTLSVVVDRLFLFIIFVLEIFLVATCIVTHIYSKCDPQIRIEKSDLDSIDVVCEKLLALFDADPSSISLHRVVEASTKASFARFREAIGRI